MTLKQQLSKRRFLKKIDIQQKKNDEKVKIENEIPKEKNPVKNNEKKETDEDDELKQTSKNKIRQRLPRNQISSDANSTECPECGKEFTLKGNMVKHYRYMHEGIKYPCNQCDYQAGTQGCLQKHIEAKHSDIILNCELCDFQTKWSSNYSTHMRTHEKNPYFSLNKMRTHENS